MNFNWTGEQKALRAKYAQFGMEVVAPRAAACHDQSIFDQVSWTALCGTDFWRQIVPKVYGGLGSNWWDFTAAAEGLASSLSNGGFLLSVISQAGFIRGLAQHGSAAQKEKYFPRLLAGALSATCIAESHSGSHTPAVRTTVTGPANAWQLNGEKWNIAHAPIAEILLVVGRIPALGKRDISLFLLDESHAGITRGPAQNKMGNRSLPTSWLEFRNVPICEADLLGPPGDGLRTLQAILAIDRVYYGLLGSLMVRPALREAHSFLAKRQTGNSPLLEQQHVQRKFADAALALKQSLWLGRAALSQVLESQPQASLSSSAAKLSGAETAIHVARDMVSLLGSRGYQTGTASRLLQDALGFLAVGGTEDLHRINLFNQMQRSADWF
ncbi:MAG TPA: acyl-CoA dehydrogenase [Bacteroidetes bacterium]|nr:acyl-CoA dehydrogenase [Bacteroidota bacterium]